MVAVRSIKVVIKYRMERVMSLDAEYSRNPDIKTTVELESKNSRRVTPCSITLFSSLA